MYDLRQDGQYKRTCRTCLGVSKAKYNAKAAHAAMRDTKKIRNDIVAAIYTITDSNILTQVLTLVDSSRASSSCDTYSTKLRIVNICESNASQEDLRVV